MRCAVALVVMVFAVVRPAGAAERPPVQEFLDTGRLSAGETSLTDYLQQAPDDDEARFGLGALQFIRAVERLGQSLHRYGAGVRSQLVGEVPFLRLPVPDNANPQKPTYELSRRIFADMAADLSRAENTLAAIKDDKVLLRLKLGPVRLDLDGDGQADDPFRVILGRYLRAPAEVAGAAEMEIAFDRGDVAWLRGYCHLLSALCEFILAHDGRELFEHTAHLFFARVDTPFAGLRSERRPGEFFPRDEIFDFVAFIHLIRLDVAEPKRMQSALAHFEQVFALSRESWTFILAEIDDDHEWLPNPAQKNGALGRPVRQDQIDGWLTFIDEAEALFAGQRLVPFWRGDEGRGINLRKAFTEPRTFDLVLWIQGSAAVPYLEPGPLTRPDVWQRLERVFGGEFFGFALWFN